MKKQSFLNIPLISAVIFCLAIHALSTDIQSQTIDFSGCSTTEQCSLMIDHDSLNDDQINQSRESNMIGETESKFVPLNNCFLIRKYFLSIWQPPKIS